MTYSKDSFADVAPNKGVVMAASGPERPRRLRGGRRNPASRRNARPKAIKIFRSGLSSRALRHGVFHRGTVVGKAYVARQAALTAHLGGDPTVPQEMLISQAARLWLLGQFAWLEISRFGAFRDGKARTAIVDAYLRVAAHERAVLALIGLDRKAKQLPSLEDYLSGAEPVEAAKQPEGES